MAEAISPLDPIVGLIAILASVSACLTCAYAAWRAHRVLRLVWTLVSGSALAWTSGATVLLIQHGSTVQPSGALTWADGGFLMSVPLAVAALLLLPRGRAGRRKSSVRTLIDGVLLVATTLFISWGTALGQIYADNSSGVWREISALAHPLSDVALVAIAVFVIARFANRASFSFQMLLSGLLVIPVADTVVAYLQNTASTVAVYPLEIAWAAGFLMIAVGAFRATTTAPPTDVVKNQRWIASAPYLLLVIAGVVGCIKLLTTGHIKGVLAWDGLFIAVVVAVRQFLLVAETESLAKEVQQRNADLDQVIQERTTALTDSLEILHQANEERRRLLLRLLSSQEQERRRISDIIHDDMLQTVSIAQLQLYAIRRKGVPEGLEARFESLTKSIEDSTIALRELMSDLRLQALELGFQTAIERVIDLHSQKNEGGAQLVNRVDFEPQPTLAAAIYRNIREALANVQKHAPGSDVTVTLEATSSQFVVSVADNGPGFVVADARSPEGHIGLSSMREQVEALGGSIVLESEPGKGTTVRFFLPLHVEHSVEPDTTMGGPSRDLETTPAAGIPFASQAIPGGGGYGR